MIDAKELRIGNYIHSDLMDSSHRVTGIIDSPRGEWLYTDLQESYSDFKDWSFIPLTPEILEHCGFRFIYPYNDNGKYKMLMVPSGAYMIQSEDRGKPIWSSLKYLHQLQNLIFAMDGKELEVNLTAKQPA